MTKNRFLGNTIWILGGQIVKMLISLLISVLTARFLGPSNYGVLNYVNSYIAFFTSLIGLGLNGVIIYELVNHKDEEGTILGTCIVLRLIASVFCSGAFVGLIYLTDGQDEIIILVSLLQTIQFPFLAVDTINYWYQSKLLSKKAVIIQTISYIIVSLYKVYLLVTHKGVSWFSFAITLDAILLAIMYLISYQKNKTQPLKFSWPIAKRILKACGPFILANMMIVIYGQIDKIMIKQLLGNNDLVGLYSVALAICSLIGFIPMAILDSARPLIVEAKNNDENEFGLKFRQLACAIIWICILYSIAVTFLSYYIIKLLYGDEYLGADICLKIAVWYTAFSYLGSARSLWLICNNLNKFVFVFSALGAIVNVALNFLFIPFLSIEGAAIATLITQMLANFIFPLLFKKTRTYAVEVMKSIIFKDVKLKDMLSKIVKRKKDD